MSSCLKPAAEPMTKDRNRPMDSRDKSRSRGRSRRRSRSRSSSRSRSRSRSRSADKGKELVDGKLTREQQEALEAMNEDPEK